MQISDKEEICECYIIHKKYLELGQINQNIGIRN